MTHLSKIDVAGAAGALIAPRHEKGVTTARNAHALEQGIREKIASTLGRRAEAVIIDGWRVSGVPPSIIHCRGAVGQQRVFVKVFLADPYPSLPRIMLPWEGSSPGEPLRRVDEQIEAECWANEYLRAGPGGNSVPVLLGRSTEERTAVWEEVGGVRLDQLLLRSRWSAASRRTVGEALYQAGAWLRKVHDATFRHNAEYDVPSLLVQLRYLAEQARGSSDEYAQRALRWIERVGESMGGGPLVIPVALNHGDFSLPNLLWDHERGSLAVVDFEHAGYRSVCQDLLTLIYDLRVLLLRPFRSPGVIRHLEASFWKGYGSVPGGLVEFVGAVAMARIFFYFFPRFSNRRDRGWVAGVAVSAYKAFLEDWMISRRLSGDSSGARPDPKDGVYARS